MPAARPTVMGRVADFMQDDKRRAACVGFCIQIDHTIALGQAIQARFASCTPNIIDLGQGAKTAHACLCAFFGQQGNEAWLYPKDLQVVRERFHRCRWGGGLIIRGHTAV